MTKIYTPKEWYSLFDCPCLIIDDDGKIWAADQYYKVLFGEPSGRIDYAGGKIYGKDLGYGMFAEPISYLETKNGVTRVLDAKKGLFSSPILYIQDNKVYTPEQWTSFFDNPGGYGKEDPPSGGGHSGGSSGSSSGGGGTLIAVLSVGLVLALPAIFVNITKVAIVAAVIYLIWAIVVLLRHGTDFNARNLGKGMLNGFLSLVVVYLVLFAITNFGRGTINHEVDGWNELAAWIAGAGTLLLHFGK